MKIFPLRPRGKTPLTPHGFKDATTDLEAIASWWRKYPDANIGLVTGPESGLWVLDVDGAEGSASLALLEQEHGALPATPLQRTGKGRHIAFAWPLEGGVGNSAGKLGAGLDTRGAGGYIVLAPSVHPSGDEYAWDAVLRPSKMAFAQAPDWLLAMLAQQKPITSQIVIERPAALPDSYAQAALDGEYRAVAEAKPGNRNQALNAAAFSLGQLIPSGVLARSAVERTLEAASGANGQLAEDGQPSITAVIRSGIEAGMRSPRVIEPRRSQLASPPSAGTREAPAAVAAGKPQIRVVEQVAAPSLATEPVIDAEMSRNSTGGLKANSVRNAIAMLEGDEAVAGLFAFDEFTNQVVVTRRPPWTRNGHSAGLLTDNDVTGAAAWLERKGQTISLSNLFAAVQFVAAENHINPVRDTLADLKWDGIPRLSDWLCDYMDAPETALTRTVAAKWVIGAVARIMRPGAKVDTMLILEGPQGLKKSTALAALATIGGREYFADKLPALGSKDAALELQGKVIVEIAELDALHKAEVSQVKAWLSQRVDRFRPPYGRAVVERPRQCVFAGTVNPGASGYLNDPTGGRRFWPVTVSRVDLAGLQEAVPKLWAEAVVRYHDGESWWLEDDEVIGEAREAQRERYDADVWSDRINDYVANKSRVRIIDVLADAIELPKHMMTEATKKRVAAHLRFEGWTRRKWRDPSRGGQPTWYFVRDEPLEFDFNTASREGDDD
jgi:predicted P-loop ATPase